MQLAPLLGILGTVLGLTDAFLSLGNITGQAKIQFLAHGIGKALSTTIIGLAVSMISMFGNYVMKYKISKIISIAEEKIERFITLMSKSN